MKGRKDPPMIGDLHIRVIHTNIRLNRDAVQLMDATDQLSVKVISVVAIPGS